MKRVLNKEGKAVHVAGYMGKGLFLNEIREKKIISEELEKELHHFMKKVLERFKNLHKTENAVKTA